jgi:hypothetical protein
VVIVIIRWWNGYECGRDEVSVGFREVLCNCCLAPMGIFVPEEWPRIEALCSRCDDEQGDDSI